MPSPLFLICVAGRSGSSDDAADRTRSDRSSLDEDKPVLPMMDYEAVSPPAIDEAYARIAPAYREVFCGIGAGAMRFAKQLFWQESAFPAEFARAKT